MPAWVARVVVLSDDDDGCWMWCDAAPSVPGYSGQMVLDRPAGRYLVDVFDPGDGTCLSRESAAGGPLVAGLPRVASEVLVHVSRVEGVGEALR